MTSALLASIVPELLLAILGVLALSFLLAVGVTWWGLRRLRRSTRLQRGSLVLRAAVRPPGPRREIAQLRLRLSDELAHTQRCLRTLTVAGGRDRFGELLGRLRHAAGQLDTQLRLLRDEPTEALLAAELPELRTRAQRVSSGARTLRHTAMRLGNEVDAPVRDRLERDLADEIAGLEAGVDEMLTMQHSRGDPPGGTARA